MILNRVMPISKIRLSHLWFGHLIFWIMTTSFLRKRRGAYWYLPINASPFKPHCHHLPFVYYKFSRFPNLPGKPALWHFTYTLFFERLSSSFMYSSNVYILSSPAKRNLALVPSMQVAFIISETDIFLLWLLCTC